MNFITNLGIGKRKQAIARVFFKPGSGNLIINKVPGEKYLQYNQLFKDEQFHLTETPQFQTTTL